MGNYVALIITSSQTMTVHLKYRVEIAEKKKSEAVQDTKSLHKKKKDEKKIEKQVIKASGVPFLLVWF